MGQKARLFLAVVVMRCPRLFLRIHEGLVSQGSSTVSCLFFFGSSSVGASPRIFARMRRLGSPLPHMALISSLTSEGHIAHRPE